MSTASDGRPLRVLLVEDDADARSALGLAIGRDGYDVLAAGDGAQALALADDTVPDLAVLDVVLPDTDGLTLFKHLRARHPSIDAVLVTACGTVEGAVAAIAAGAFNYVEKPVDPAVVLALLAGASTRVRLSVETRRLVAALEAARALHGDLLERTPGMRPLSGLIRRVAPTDASVLIAGENGTGKELVADALHAQSRRAQGPLVKVNCAAIPADLIEAELFGHARGAFTGAVRERAGLFEQARGGTVLLDEIGELPMPLQPKLLRVLQDRSVRPVGALRAVALDFRLLCSTNRDLEAAVRAGRFREDLYFRINTVTLLVPPLRDRREDIPVVAEGCLARFRAQYRRAVEGISLEAYRALMAHAWPGNVRELEHAVERAVIVTAGPEIELADLPDTIVGRAAVRATADTSPLPTLEALERDAITRALERTGGNKRAAAALLGLYRPTLYSKLKKHGLLAPSRPPAEPS